MTAKVILNPFSGRGAALKRLEEMKAALAAAGVAYELVLTERPSHATELAQQAVAQGCNPIIAAGGDGLLSEVLNGIAAAAGDDAWPTFGVMPMGTANDLIENLGMPTDLAAAAQVIARGTVRRLDMGRVNGRVFHNNAGLGLESHISAIQNRMTWAKGIFRYLSATLWGIMQNPQWRMHLQWDDGEYNGPVTLVSIGNAPRTGGIFYTVPHADPFDGRLTFVYGHIPTRLQILRVLPRTMKPDVGNYVEHPAVHEVHATWLRVRAETPTPMHADGEIVSGAVQELFYEVLPQKLPLLMGN
ncbi:MAG: diacylglycerol kinase family lipid kinase [Ardenticatenaceae bacterium]|nr:diacylglycerol kinase family lipid kinase [Ardenticatenaceae bacterium]